MCVCVCVWYNKSHTCARESRGGLHKFVCVCVCVWVGVSLHVCIDESTHICTCNCIFAPEDPCCLHKCVCVCVCVVCVCVCVCACVRAYQRVRVGVFFSSLHKCIRVLSVCVSLLTAKIRLHNLLMCTNVAISPGYRLRYRVSQFCSRVLNALGMPESECTEPA